MHTDIRVQRVNTYRIFIFVFWSICSSAISSPVPYTRKKKALTTIKALIDKLFESLDQTNHNMHSKPRRKVSKGK